LACNRSETRAANTAVEATATEPMVPHHVSGVVTFDAPSAWPVNHVAYPSRYGAQSYHVVRSGPVAASDEMGVLTIDVTPSHPSLWRKPLSEWVDHRLRALGTVGAVSEWPVPLEAPELPYSWEERLVTVQGHWRTVFRVFRQESRVIVVAFTADTDHFEAVRATQLVRHVSDTLLIHLPVVAVERIAMKRNRRRFPGVLSANLPVDWAANIETQPEGALLPVQTLVLRARSEDQDSPTITINVARLQALGSSVEVEQYAVSSQPSVPRGDSVFQAGEQRLGMMRLIHVDGNMVTCTITAPDYEFELKEAMAFMDSFEESLEILPMAWPDAR